ncbi:MAG: SH3 domain-containing protein [Clostridia bacterium]|nr:SH3 domain-containing protein [Clostridia bacterium]
MKNPAGLIVTVLIIVVPIVWCCISLINTNKEYDENLDKMQSMTDDINEVINDNLVDNIESGEDKSSGDTYTGSMAGDPYQSAIGAPIGKIVENATINIGVANVYTNPDETSDIIGTVTKNSEVTSQDYPNGWSRIKIGELSGWTKTEYIDKPGEIGNTSIGTVIGKTGIIKAASLNVRKTPVTGEIITTLTKDTDVKILAANEENTWYQVQWRTTLGWVSAEYVEVQY